jgi:hypothetical protein
LHELGHIFFQRLTRTDAQRWWATEFLASYFAICYLKRHPELTVLPIPDWPAYIPTRTSLEDFDSLYLNMVPQNFAWYQGRFIRLGNELYDRHGLKLIRSLLDDYGEGKKHQEVFMLLREHSPDVVDSFRAVMR